MFEFLKERQDILESIEEPHSNTKISNQFNKPPREFYPRSQVNLSLNGIKCNLCKGEHTIYTCKEFLKLSVNQRWDKIKALELCSNCLRIGHAKNTCTIGSCKRCRRKHNTLLHYNSGSSHSNNQSITSESNEDRNNVAQSSSTYNNSDISQSPILMQTHFASSNDHKKSQSVLLSTVTFNVKDNKGNFHTCRALLDSGAQSNLVTKSFCQRLGLQLITTNLAILGINQTVSNLTKKTNIVIYSKFNSFQHNITCYVVPTITSSIPLETIDISSIDIPNNLHLSDPDFHMPDKVDMLIGAALFWDLLIDGKITLRKAGPILQNTKLGWIISGRFSSMCHQSSICNFSQNIPEDDQLKKFWSIDKIPITNSMSKDDSQCEYLFSQDTYRNRTGQFVVKFPLKQSPSLLGDSKEMAIQRFLSLERKFSSKPKFYSLYKEFINEYIQLGHMTKILDTQNILNYYAPHHGVLKESITTQLRVVFDFSCPSKSGYSLNDLQYVGLKVQNNIFDILIRFRLYKYVVSADISKMYRQILMHEDHKSLQQIIWRNNPNEQFSTYQLNTVTYGATSSPYLAIRCINQLAIEYQESFPIASKSILSDFYVDDLLTGSDDIIELQDRCRDISLILKSAHFILRKWVSNDARVLNNIGTSDIPNEILNIGESESFKTLGIQWSSKQDILRYKICSIKHENHITKRQILSTISQIYDPLGILSPVIIISKIIIQQLWSLKLPWDEPVPETIFIKWFQFYNQLPILNQLKIPRLAVGRTHKLLDLHCFCDASLQAYASCIYIRSVDAKGIYQTHLLCSKAKVAPLKSITIPRLELLASLLGAQLVDQLLKGSFPSIPIYFWSDSQIVLCWLKKEPNQLQTFVANRVSKIQKITEPYGCFYVNTKENPADLASRGVLPENLANSKLWFYGPEFLHKPFTQLSTINECNLVIPDLKKASAIFTTKIKEPSALFLQFSTFNKLHRVTSYLLRFISNSRKASEQRVFGCLTVSELNCAHILLLKLAQLDSFHEEFSLLKLHTYLPSKHKFSSFAPFLDKDNLIRVGGRLRFTSLESNKKHPVLLSSKHPLTKLIFAHKHSVLLHPGPNLLLSAIRQFYWPVGGRNLARKICNSCMTCFKFNPSFASYPMSSLPDNRVTPSLPFQYTGIDYAGPFSLKDKNGRGYRLNYQLERLQEKQVVNRLEEEINIKLENPAKQDIDEEWQTIQTAISEAAKKVNRKRAYKKTARQN
ncbi:uncharacterized protein [Diabrotica undecimpunctata]|uniref:uncharacterized protein n=1 Tax=Diabrotica undecimpunctata TaxID=50387 RepID=UPI003B63595B